MPADHDELRRIGNSMRRCREAQKISLRAFARMLNVTPSYVSDIELGLRRPGYRLAQRISVGLNLRLTPLWERQMVAAWRRA